MKTWTMPRVAVEAFRANEYVSSCEEYLVKTNELANNYIDLHEPDKHLYDYEYESVGAVTGGRVLVGNYNTPTVGWYRNVKGYHYNPGASLSTTPQDGYDYLGNNGLLGTSTFTELGTYTLYVYKMTDTAHAWVYKAGYTPGGTPTEDTPYS